MISAINGPALRHSEMPLLCDIVLAAEETTFQDSAHFPNGLVPGDACTLYSAFLLGLNRGRYFLLTGQTLNPARRRISAWSASPAREQLLPRAWTLAEQLVPTAAARAAL